MATGTKLGPDSRAQIAAIKATESAANTLTVALFSFPFSVMDKMALNIHRIEYWPAHARLAGDGDVLAVGLITAKTIADITDQTDPVLVDSFTIERNDAGTAADAVVRTVPYVKDFANLPGGGLLVPPNPLGIAIKGTSLVAAGICWVRIHYTYLQLTTDEYWQLVEARRVISNA